MIVEKFSINVGESTVIYIEMYSGDTAESDLKYGDCKFDDDGKMLIWYGTDNPDMSGWVTSPWAASNYTGILLNMAADSKNNPKDIIWRIMNNDIYFDESTYNPVLDNVVEPTKLSIDNKGDHDGQ